MHPNNNIIMTGDFNVNLLQESTQAKQLLECTLDHNMLQGVTLPTRITEKSETLIDHAYVRTKADIQTDVIIADLSDHFILLTTFLNKRKKRAKQSITKRWLKDEHYDIISTMIAAENWDILRDMNAEESASCLVSKIQEILDTVCPIETKEVSKKPVNKWMTPGVTVSLITANKLYKKYKKRKSAEDRQSYKKYKKLLDSVIRKAKDIYYGIKIDNCQADSRKLWSLLNEVIDRKQCRHKMPSNFIVNGKTVQNKKNIANAFNNYFASIGKSMADDLPTVDGYEEYLRSNYIEEFFLLAVEEKEVESIMRHQQPKLSCGIDTINNRIVKSSSIALAKPMTIVINKSIEEQKVSSVFKIARIIPLYKKGAANECGNYRPVSLLSALSKILEKVICKQMMRHLNKRDLLCSNQYGFRPKSQTNHVVQKLLNFITDSSAENKVTVATYIDLSKAFDCLQYDKLFTKMRFLGFDTDTINWFKSYLSERKQVVDLEGTISSTVDMQLGVPQGSILGPILFFNLRK